jgi:hypothetical protein
MLVPAGVPLTLTAGFVGGPTAADVAASIYDVTTASPVKISGPTLMVPLVGGAYITRFTPAAGKRYSVFMAVYTDNTFATLNGSFAAVTADVTSQNLSPQTCDVVGFAGSDEALPECGQPFTIFLGDAKTMYFQAINSACSNVPLDLTNCTEIIVALPNADGTLAFLMLSTGGVVVGPTPELGQFSVPISSVVSALLNTGTFQEVDVTFTISGEVFTVPFVRALSVFEVG